MAALFISLEIRLITGGSYDSIVFEPDGLLLSVLKQKVSKEFKAVNKFLKFCLLGEMNPNSLRSNSGFKIQLSNAEFLYGINSMPELNPPPELPPCRTCSGIPKKNLRGPSLPCLQIKTLTGF